MTTLVTAADTSYTLPVVAAVEKVLSNYLDPFDAELKTGSVDPDWSDRIAAERRRWPHAGERIVYQFRPDLLTRARA